jgi:hypothetical protein
MTTADPGDNDDWRESGGDQSDVDWLFSQLESEIGEGTARIRRETTSRSLLAVAGVVVGLVVCIIGLGVGLWLSAAGFALMFASSVYAARQLRLLGRLASDRATMALLAVNPMSHLRRDRDDNQN